MGGFKRMVVKPTRLASKVLSEINESETFDSLSALLEMLENKIEPDMNEIHIVSTLYQIQEKVKLLESHLTSYVGKANKKTLCGKLEEIYDQRAAFGSSRLFED
jgi:hypothetical protein